MSLKNSVRVAAALAALALTPLLAGCGYSGSPPDQQALAFSAASEQPEDYRIGPGDDLSVVLPYNPELNYEGPVGPDSHFTMPVVGIVSTAGKTVPEVEVSISKALTDQHVASNPKVSVSIRHYAQVVYVGGEVKTPGAVALQGKMDPLQAITVAGGMLDTARTGEVVIIRRGADGRPVRRVVDVAALVRDGDPAQQIALKPQDTIFVPKSSVAEVDLWVDQYINKTLPFNRGFSYSVNNNIGNGTTTTTTNP